MSYCRWSTDNYKCDVYAYESVYGGFEIHIASHRYVGEVPEVPPVNEIPLKEWKAKNKVQREYLDNCGTEPIGLLLDGKTFSCNTINEFYEKMNQIKDTGYNIPGYVFKRIESELKAE